MAGMMVEVQECIEVTTPVPFKVAVDDPIDENTVDNLFVPNLATKSPSVPSSPTNRPETPAEEIPETTSTTSTEVPSVVGAEVAIIPPVEYPKTRHASDATYVRYVLKTNLHYSSFTARQAGRIAFTRKSFRTMSFRYHLYLTSHSNNCKRYTVKSILSKRDIITVMSGVCLNERQ